MKATRDQAAGEEQGAYSTIVVHGRTGSRASLRLRPLASQSHTTEDQHTFKSILGRLGRIVHPAPHVSRAWRLEPKLLDAEVPLLLVRGHVLQRQPACLPSGFHLQRLELGLYLQTACLRSAQLWWDRHDRTRL